MKNKKQNFSQHPKRKKMKIKKGWVIFFKTFLCVSFAFSLTLGGAWLFCQSTFEAAYSPEFNYSSSQKEPVAQTPSSSNNSEPSKPLQTSSTSTPNLQHSGTAPLGEIPVILQKPELPAGCEATSASMLLCAYGYNVDKNVFAQALPKSSFETYNGRLYAAHPNDAFIGSPDSSYGYGVLARPVVKVMQDFIDNAGGNHRVIDITGSSEDTILSYIDRGIPVCIWSTIGMLPLVNSGGWYLKKGASYTDDYYTWPGNEHCMILISYCSDNVTVHDPLKGIKTYDRHTFFQRYTEVGKYAIVLGLKNDL